MFLTIIKYERDILMIRKWIACLLISLILVTGCGQKSSQSSPLGLRYLASGYKLQQVVPTAFGLPAQLAMLTNGDVAISSCNNQMYVFSGGTVKTLDENERFQAAVAALPDGSICCSKENGQIVAMDPVTGSMKNLCKTPLGDSPSALICDKDGNIYAATRRLNLFRFDPAGNRTTIATNLPFAQTGYSITDMDIAADGTLYIMGYDHAVTVSPSGKVTDIIQNLQASPTFCEITPDGSVYIKDISLGVMHYDPATVALTKLKIFANVGVADFLALSDDEFLFTAGVDLIFTYNMDTRSFSSLFVNTIDSLAFAAGANNSVFLASASLAEYQKSHMVKVNADGTSEDMNNLSYLNIGAADVDFSGRLCIGTSDGFFRVEKDSSVTPLPLKTDLTELFPNRMGDLAIGPDGKWYCITTDFNDSVTVYCFDENNDVKFLPISFNRASFGNACQVAGARIDIGPDGKLIIFVTAIGVRGQGPFYQRVYRANPDGTDLTLIANFDSKCPDGMVDVAVGPDNNIYAMTAQFTSGIVYRINTSNKASKFLVYENGRDPKSIDVDPAGNLWIGTTVGIFRTQH